MGGGGKGGKSESKTEIDPQLQAASLDALDYAATAARLPFTPNRGAQIAAPTSQMQNSMQGANTASSAFGLATAPMSAPQTVTTPNGIESYTSGGVYDQAKAASYTPEMQDSIDSLFVDPQTGLIPEFRSPIYNPHYGGGKGQPARPGLPSRYPYGGNDTPAVSAAAGSLPFWDSSRNSTGGGS